jgi:hypothetical protein
MDWRQLAAELEGNCEYCGNDFAAAQREAERSGATIYENSQQRGYFVVATDAQARAMFLDQWATY